MRGGKPIGLKTAQYTKAKKERMTENENAMLPDTDLPMNAPSFFENKIIKPETVYKRLMRLYNQLDAIIITALDRDLIVNYCKMIEESSELNILRRQLFDMYSNDPDSVSLSDLLAIDARHDRKVSLINTFAHSLYLTPRARAGVVPDKKEIKIVNDPFEDLLNDLESRP